MPPHGSIASVPPHPGSPVFHEAGPAAGNINAGELQVPGGHVTVAAGQVSAATAALLAMAPTQPLAADLTKQLQHGPIAEVLNSLLDPGSIVQLSSTCQSWRVTQQKAITSSKETWAELKGRARFSDPRIRWTQIGFSLQEQRPAEAVWLLRRLVKRSLEATGRPDSVRLLLPPDGDQFPEVERVMLRAYANDLSLTDQEIESVLTKDPSAFIASLRGLSDVQARFLNSRTPGEWVKVCEAFLPESRDKALAQLCDSFRSDPKLSRGRAMELVAEGVLLWLKAPKSANTPLVLEALAQLIRVGEPATVQQHSNMLALVSILCHAATDHERDALAIAKPIIAYCISIHATQPWVASLIWNRVADMVKRVSVNERLPFLLALWPGEGKGVEWTEPAARMNAMVAALPAAQRQLADAARELNHAPWSAENPPVARGFGQVPALQRLVSSLAVSSPAYRLDAYRVVLAGMEISPFAFPDSWYGPYKAAMSAIRDDLVKLVQEGHCTACLPLLEVLHQWTDLLPLWSVLMHLDSEPVVASALRVARSLPFREAVLFWSRRTVELVVHSPSCVARLLEPMPQSYRVDWVNDFVDYCALESLRSPGLLDSLRNAMACLDDEGRGSVLRRLIQRGTLGGFGFGFDRLRSWILEEMGRMPVDRVGRLRLLEFSVGVREAHAEFAMLGPRYRDPMRVPSALGVDSVIYPDAVIPVLADIWAKAVMADGRYAQKMEQQFQGFIAKYRAENMQTMLIAVKREAGTLISNHKAASEIRNVTASDSAPKTIDTDDDDGRPSRDAGKRKREH